VRAIIIAAGRGRRLMPTTADSPKCFAEVKGKRLLDWSLQAFAANGIKDICFIGGYQLEKVRRDYPHFTFRVNDNWENNNIMASLMYAEDLMNEPFICSYADVLYTADVVARLLKGKGDIVLSVDTKWLDRYVHRTMHPPTDAEKVTATNGHVTRVHRGISTEEAYGEYTGLAKFSVAGAESLRKLYHQRRAQFSGKPYREASVFEKAYLIHLMQDMIENGQTMAHADTPGNYMEVDTQQDFELAKQNWQG